MDELVLVHESEPIQQLNSDLLRVRLWQSSPFAQLSLEVAELEIFHGDVHRVIILKPAVGSDEAVRILHRSQWDSSALSQFMVLADAEWQFFHSEAEARDSHERWRT